MADMCYECQFSDNGYFCRFMEHGACTAVSCKWMIEFEGRSARDNCKLLNGTNYIKEEKSYERKENVEHLSRVRYERW